MGGRGGSVVPRRTFLGSAVAAGAVLAMPRAWRGPLLVPAPAATFDAPPFTLGVASGDPRPDGVVLWTRLAPDPQAPDGGISAEQLPVRWEVASDERFRTVVRHGTTTTRARDAHSVHVDVRGLDPAHDYFYRFHIGAADSPVGRTRTAPASDAMPKRMRLAFASCQSYDSGYFSSHRHLADEDLDLVLFLGDYIYESGATPGNPRSHEGPEPTDLVGYRRRYGTYKADAQLQAAHAAFPWMITWDDHEVENNYAGELSQAPGVPPAEFRIRRAAAYKAWWEHTPARVRRPTGFNARIYRTLSFGRLAQFFMLDTRQYRTNQPCGSPSDIGAQCADAKVPGATLMGAEQEHWLFQGLRRSHAQWNVIAQQVLMAQANFLPGSNGGNFDLDAWDGYPAARTRLLATLRSEQVANPVVLSGDIHSSWVNDLALSGSGEGSPVATEFVGTSITSSFPLPDLVTRAVSKQPHIKYFDGSHHGYVRCELDANQWQADQRFVSTITAADATIVTAATFVVEAGTAGAHQA